MRATMRAVTIKLKGARYYDAEAAHACGDLALSKSVLLKPEPNNLHDKNAVAVFSHSGKMLGHISRDIAGKYKELVLLDQVVESKVYSAEKINDYQKFDIKISITYFAPDVEYEVSFPETAGSYLIALGNDRVYIGATSNLKRRCQDHMRNLVNKTHTNNALQADFNEKNLDSFKFIVLREAGSLKEAEYLEASEIRNRLNNGETLYNKTIDGKGIVSKYESGLHTISDFGKAPQYHSHFETNLSAGKVQEPESKNVLYIGKDLHEGIEKVTEKNLSATTLKGQKEAYIVENSLDAINEKAWLDGVRASALKGDCRAQFCLGLIYASESFLEKSDNSALKWFLLAAEQGYAKAQFHLGILLQKERSHSKNQKEAEKWHRLAAEKGLPDAQIQLGLIYRDGIGVLKNYDEALKWFRKAVMKGSAIATFHLGDMHRNGMGISQNALNAYSYYSAAAASGLNEAKEKMNYLKIRFSKEDLEKGNAMAKEIAETRFQDLI
jgi:TPR repeat protein